MTLIQVLVAVMAVLSQYPVVRCQLEFIDSPASATVLANFPTTLSCSLHPGPASTSLSVAWEKDGLPLVPDNQRVSTTFDSSTRRSELRITSVSYNDAGVYLCRAEDEATGVQSTSTSATITVQGIPVFDAPLAPVTVSLGTVAELECQVVSNPPATITWSYELGSLRRNLTTGGRVIIAPSNMLTILNVEAADAGYYVCTAQNVFGRNMTSGRLQIGAPVAPFQVTITPSEPDPLMLVEGDSVTLRCTVPPTTTISSITWTRLGVALSSVTQISSGLLLSLTLVGKDAAAQYACVVIDTAGTNVSRSIEIIVSSPPVFVEEPADVIGEVGLPLEASLVCTADADPPATITWLDPDLNPLMVNPATDAPQFTTLSRSDEGIYTCVAANTIGEIRSQFTITVQAPPDASTERSSVTTPPGQDLTLQCSASGSPPASISWSKSGGVLPATSIATGNTLYLYSVSSSDAGTYLCTASNSIGSDSTPIQLTVLANPQITSSTVSPVVLSAGSSLVLSCFSTGPPETTLAWYHNATRLDPSTDADVRVNLDGTLTIRNTDISNTGTYTCNVSTSFTFVLSHVQVVVGVPPIIVAPPTDTDLPPGARALLSCQAGGFPSPHATWFRTDIVSEERVELDIVGPSYTQLSGGLELHDVSGSDTGTYACVVENALGSDVQQAIVRVGGPPVATSIQPTVFSADSTVTLNCSTILNFPPGVVTWRYSSGAPLPADRFSVDQDGVLTASPILLEDTGSQIMCRVTNQYGQSSIVATIQILFRPVVTVATPTEGVLVGGMAVLSCSARGDPLPVISWRLPDGSDPQDLGNVQVNAASGNLTVFSAGGQNSGTYTCTATNSLGSNSATGQLVIRGEPVGDLTGIVGTTSLRVEWTDVPGQSGLQLQSFDIQVIRQGRTEPTVQSSLSFFTRVFMNAELAPGLTYEVRLTGVFSQGIVGLPRSIFLTTLEDVPTGPPLNLEASPLENGIQLEWELPHEDERNGVIISYNVEYRQAANNPLAPYQTVSVTPNPGGENETTNHTLLSLNGGTSYDVRVVAFTAIGPGPPSDIVTVTTIRVPVPPTVGIGVGVAVGCVVLIVAVVVGVSLLCLLHRRRTRVGKHEPMAAEEKGKKKDEKDKKKAISGPVAGITPKIDQGKFKVQGQHGNSIDLKPKVITSKDMAPPPTRGGSVKKVPRSETVLAASNDESDQGRIDPYSTPPDAVKKTGQVQARQRISPSPRVQVKGTVAAGVYSEVSEVMRTPPRKRSGDDDDDEEEGDKPYEEMEIGSADTWQEERSLGSRGASPEHPEAPDEGMDTSNLLYASVPQAHVDKKREKRQQVEQQLTKEEEKRREKELKQQKKMQEKMERERLKMEEKERKRKEKEKEQERKRVEAEMKRRAEAAKQRESMGLSNIVSYRDIDFSKPGSRAKAGFIDAATAAMF